MSPSKKDEELSENDISEEEEEEKEEEEVEEKDEDENLSKDANDDDVEEDKDDEDASPNPITDRNKMDSSDIPLNSAKTARKTTRNSKADDDFVEVQKSKEDPIFLSNEELMEIYKEKKENKGEKEKFLLKDVHKNPVKFVAVTKALEDDSDDDNEDDEYSQKQYLISASAFKEGSVKIFNFNRLSAQRNFLRDITLDIYCPQEVKTKKEVFHWEKPHDAQITAMVVTSDGEYIITGSEDKSIKIFDVSEKEESEQFKNIHEGKITSLAVSADNNFLLSGSHDYSVKVFDLSTKKEIYHFKDFGYQWVTAVAFTPDNKFVLVGLSAKIKVFDFETKKKVNEFELANMNQITSIAVTSDSKFIIAASCDVDIIKVLDLQTKKEVYHFKDTHPLGVNSLTLTSDDRYIISSGNYSFKVYDLQTKQLVHSSLEEMNYVAVTSDSKYIISGLINNSIKIFDFFPKMETHCFKEAHSGDITSMIVTSDSKYLITGSEDYSIKVFDLQNKNEFCHFEDAHEEDITSLHLTSDDKFVISGSKDKSIKVFDIQNQKKFHQFPDAHEGEIISMIITSDNKFIVSGSAEGDIKIFDIQNKKEVCHFKEAHEAAIEKLFVTPDNRFIISADSMDASIKVFDLQTKAKTPVRHFEEAHEYGIKSLAVTPDSRFIVSTGSYESSIKLFDLHTLQEVYHLQNAHDDEIQSITITPDQRFIISLGSDQYIKIFDFKTKQLVHEFQNSYEDAYKTLVESIIVTPDSRYLLFCSDPYTIQVFDLQTKRPIHHLKADPDEEQFISSFAVTPDNKYIIAGSDMNYSIKMFEFYPNNQSQKDYTSSKTEKPKTPGSAGSKSTKIFDLSTREKEMSSSLNENPRHSIRIPSILNQEVYFVSNEMKKFSIFNNIDDFLFDKTAEISIPQALKQSDLFVLPFRWTILHLVSLHGNHDFIAKMPAYKQFKMPFLVDTFDRTPMHYLVVQKTLRSSTINVLFRYICDYLDDCHAKNPHEFQKIIESLTSLLPFILQKIEAKLRCRFLKIACTKSSVPYGKPLPVFGTIENESAVFCRSPVLSQETREKIWAEQGTTQIEFRSNYLYLDYHILSQDMKEVVDDLKEQDGDEIFKAPAISTLIDHLWKQAERSLFLFFTLYSAFIITLSVYLTFNDRSLPYEIVLIAGAGAFTANELWQVYNLTKDYLRSPWNWIDLGQLLLTIAFLITRITDNENELARAWMSTIIVIFGYLRWISLLKIFKPTRNFIEIVITIVKAMISFIVVLVMIIIAFSIIFLVFNREAGYGDYLYEAYNVMYGPMDIDEEAAWPFSQKLLMAVLAFFLNVVLLNLLISIMGDAFGKAGEAQDKTDALTRLEMISEAMILRKIVNPNHKTKRGYLVYCLPAELEEEEHDQQEQLKKMTEAIKQLQQNDESLKEQISSLDAFIRSSLKK